MNDRRLGVGSYLIDGLSYEEAQRVGNAVNDVAKAKDVGWHELRNEDVLKAAANLVNPLHRLIDWHNSSERTPLEQIERLLRGIEHLC